MEISAGTLSVVTVLMLAKAFCSPVLAEEAGLVRIQPGKYFEGNIPIENDTRIRWQTHGPEPEPGHYFAKWNFAVAGDGEYALHMRCQASATLHFSRFLWAIDGSKFLPALTLRKVDLKGSFERKLPVYEPVFEIGRVKLNQGTHVLEVRGGKEQRFWHQERDGGHNQFIESIEIRPVLPRQNLPQRESGFRLKDGDTVVVLGDSITDGGAYLGCMAQAIYAAYPERRINLYNCGVGAERAKDACYRLQYDVLPLKPDWFVLAMGVNDSFFYDGRQFIKHCEQILDEVKQQCGARIILPTPTVLDEHPRLAGSIRMWEADRVVAYNRSIELEYLPAVRALAEKYAAIEVDIYRPFRQVQERLTGKEFPYVIQDQIHPSDNLGAWAMASAYLQALGFSRDDFAKAPIPPESREIIEDAFAHPWQVKPCAHLPQASRELSAGKYVAAASTVRGSVTFFDAASGQAVAEVRLGYRPRALAHSPDGKTLYVAQEAGATIVPIQLPLLKRLPAFKSSEQPEFALPQHMAVERDGTLWVANYYLRPTILEPNGRVKAVLDGGTLTSAVAISTNGRFAAASYSMSKDLWVYALPGRTKLAAVSGKSFLSQVAFAGQQVITCDYDNSTILTFDFNNSNARWLSAGKYPRDVAIPLSADRFFVSLYGENCIRELWLGPTNTVTSHTAPVGAGPGAILLDENGGSLYVSCVRDAAIWRIDLKSWQAARWAPLEGCLSLLLIDVAVEK